MAGFAIATAQGVDLAGKYRADDQLGAIAGIEQASCLGEITVDCARSQHQCSRNLFVRGSLTSQYDTMWRAWMQSWSRDPALKCLRMCTSPNNLRAVSFKPSRAPNSKLSLSLRSTRIIRSSSDQASEGTIGEKATTNNGITSIEAFFYQPFGDRGRIVLEIDAIRTRRSQVVVMDQRIIMKLLFLLTEATSTREILCRSAYLPAANAQKLNNGIPQSPRMSLAFLQYA